MSTAAEDDNSADRPLVSDKMLPFWGKRRFKVARGGRGGGKSWGAIDYVICVSRRRRRRVVNAREVQKSIRDSVYALYVDRIRYFGIEHEYHITDTRITHLRTGSEFIFVGMRDHTVDTIKSLEGADILLIEEGQNISQRSLDVAIPTIRKPGSEIIVLYNPYLDSDPIHVWTNNLLARRPDRIVCVDINVEDNPWAPQELLDERDLAYETDPIKASNIWGGKTKQIVEGAVYAKQLGDMVLRNQIHNGVVYRAEARQVIAFDLGRNDFMHVIFGQLLGHGHSMERQIWHAYQNYNEHFSHYIDYIKKGGHRVDHIILPHDSKAKTSAALNSPYEMCKIAWPDAEIQVLAPESIELGIANAQHLMPTISMHTENAKPLIDCLQRYHRKPTGMVTSDNQVIYGDPVHDEASHGADAFRYWCQVDLKTLKTQKLDPNKFKRGPLF